MQGSCVRGLVVDTFNNINLALLLEESTKMVRTAAPADELIDYVPLLASHFL